MGKENLCEHGGQTRRVCLAEGLTQQRQGSGYETHTAYPSPYRISQQINCSSHVDPPRY